MEAIKVKAIWHNCNRCKIHYMSEEPHIRAYLCDECWFSLPHYSASKMYKTPQKPDKGPTYNGVELREIVLYTIGNLICMAIIAYYLWFK